VLLDFLSATTDIILPLSGLVASIFAGWIVSANTAREAIGFKSEIWFKRWRFLIRWVCPIGISTVIFYAVIWTPYIAPTLAG
ncbi:MAG: hypothetical protein AAFW81_12710, partial [Pseudomonadota bacterium]